MILKEFDTDQSANRFLNDSNKVSYLKERYARYGRIMYHAWHRRIILEVETQMKDQQMDIRDAVTILAEHQEWRRGNTDEMPFTPTTLGEAIDRILQFFEYEKKDDD